MGGLRLCCAVLLAGLTAACSGGGSHPPAAQPATPPVPKAADRVAPLTPPPHQLVKATGMTGLPAGATVADAFVVPGAWAVDQSGMASGGPYLVFGVVDTKVPARVGDRSGGHETWVVDSRTGDVRSVGRSESATVGADWALLLRTTPAGGPGCPDQADCWTWQLTAEPLASGAGVLVDESARPVPHAMLPVPSVDGRLFAWQDVRDEDHGTVMLWTPGEPAPRPLVQDGGVARITVDGRDVYEEIHQKGPAGAAGPSTIYRTSADGTHRKRVTTITDSCCAAVHGDFLAYLPGDRGRPGPVRVRRLSTGTETTLDGQTDPTESFVYLRWLDDHRLIVGGEQSGDLLVDVTGHTAAVFPRLTPDGGVDTTTEGHVISTDGGLVDAVLTPLTGSAAVVARIKV